MRDAKGYAFSELIELADFADTPVSTGYPRLGQAKLGERQMIPTRRGLLAMTMITPMQNKLKMTLVTAAGGSNGQLQYDNNGTLDGTIDLTWHPATSSTPTSLQLANEVNTEAADLDPRGLISIENSNTSHSAHIAGRKSRGTNASPRAVQVGDYLAALISYGYNGAGYERAGYYSHVVTELSGGHISDMAEIRVSTAGVEYNVYDADTWRTQVTGALSVVDPGGTNPGGMSYASVTLFGSQNGDPLAGWGIFAGYPNPGDFSIRERTVATYLTIKRATGAMKTLGSGVQVRNVNDSGFAPVQGQLTTDKPFTSGAPTATGYLTLYDSHGTAYKVLCG
jgi:hypothetical protein